MIKHIIREVQPEWCDFESYFDFDGLTEAGGDWNYNLFIVCNEGWGRISGFNIETYKEVQRKASYLIQDFEYVADGIYNNDGKRVTYKEIMQDYGIAYNSRKCHALKTWAQDADYNEPWDIAEYLTITTGKKWAVQSVCGYCQGDYCELVFCTEHYKNGVQNYGEIWLGCGKEFCVIDVENYEQPEDEDDEPTYRETDSVYGFIVADCEARDDEDYKRLVCDWACIDEAEAVLEMIDDCSYSRSYSYRRA